MPPLTPASLYPNELAPEDRMEYAACERVEQTLRSVIKRTIPPRKPFLGIWDRKVTTPKAVYQDPEGSVVTRAWAQRKGDENITLFVDDFRSLEGQWYNSSSAQYTVTPDGRLEVGKQLTMRVYLQLTQDTVETFEAIEQAILAQGISSVEV